MNDKNRYSKKQTSLEIFWKRTQQILKNKPLCLKEKIKDESKK
ncbi:hypothetical protein P9597_02295 [Aneurinibacillus migulanus]|nr:hypothetical protein [Aneurinibacillus migulanus]